MKAPRAVLFDLDDTLAESFQPPAPAMVDRLGRLLAHVPVAIMTAAGLPRMERDFLDVLAHSPHIDRLYVCPNSTAQCYTYEGSAWVMQYNEAFTPDERVRITRAIEESVAETDIIEPHPRYAPRIIDREAQIAFAAIGLDATLDEKRAWDPDQSKRVRLVEALKRRLRDIGCEILIGGMTTVDITRSGITKAHGVRWLAEHLRLEPREMLYVGDALYPGGNDFVVIPTGVATRATSGPDETARIIDELLTLAG